MWSVTGSTGRLLSTVYGFKKLFIDQACCFKIAPVFSGHQIRIGQEGWDNIRILLISRKIPECLQHLSISVRIQPHSGLREKSFLLSLKVDRKVLGFEVASQALAGDFSTPVAMMNSEVESQQTIPVGLISAAEQFWTERSENALPIPL